MLKYIIVLLGLFIISPLANSATYRWIDGDGVTHYSQTRPPTGNYDIVDSKQSYPSSEQPQEPSSTSPAAAGASENINVTNQTATVTVQKADQEQCQRVQADLDKLDNTPRVSLETADGVKVLTVEEKQALIDERRDWIERYCE